MTSTINFEKLKLDKMNLSNWLWVGLHSKTGNQPGAHIKKGYLPYFYSNEIKSL
jgi:hypothetical protein